MHAGVKPVLIELTDFKTKKVVDTLEVDACMVATGRAPYTQVSARKGVAGSTGLWPAAGGAGAGRACSL